MGGKYTGRYFQRGVPPGEYAAAYLADLPSMTPASLHNVRWALKWYADTTDAIVPDGAAILRWIEGLALSPRSKQSIYDRTRALYRWMDATYQFTGGVELPVLDPVQFGRRKRGEERGARKAR